MNVKEKKYHKIKRLEEINNKNIIRLRDVKRLITKIS